MELFFLSPYAALVGLAIILPLMNFVVRERRRSRRRRAWKLPAPSALSVVADAGALLAIGALLALAAAQPVVEHKAARYARTDVEALVVIDTSRSMLATRAPDAATRFDRAKALVLAIRHRFPEIPIGLVSFTDRPLPHIFPTTDRTDFAQTLNDAIGIERPPPREQDFRVTDFTQLAPISTDRFFSDQVAKRVLVVLTDGESKSVVRESLSRNFQEANIHVVFVPFWNADERIFGDHGEVEQYRPSNDAFQELVLLARFLQAPVVLEENTTQLYRLLDQYFGNGTRVVAGTQRTATSLSGFAILLAGLPFSFLIFRKAI